MKRQHPGATTTTTPALGGTHAFAANAATAYAKIARLTNANIAAAAHFSTAKASAENAVASLNAARDGGCGASAATAATAVASAAAAAKTADAAVAAADHARAAAEAAVEATAETNRKQKATYAMIEQLLFHRDPVETCYNDKFSTQSVGALTWSENGARGCCPISNVSNVTAANSLRDFSCYVREYTVEAHSDIRDFPGRLRELSDRLRRAADAADAAGFDELPGGLVGYTPTHDALVAGPGNLAQLSQGAAQLVRDLHLCRSVDEGYDGDDLPDTEVDIGNLSWVNEVRQDARHCPIAGVLDMFRMGVLFDPLAAAHTALADKYGSLQAFTQRLRELSTRMQGAAASAANLGFMQIPEQESDGEEGGEDEDGSGDEDGGEDEGSDDCG